MFLRAQRPSQLWSQSSDALRRSDSQLLLPLDQGPGHLVLQSTGWNPGRDEELIGQASWDPGISVVAAHATCCQGVLCAAFQRYFVVNAELSALRSFAGTICKDSLIDQFMPACNTVPPPAALALQPESQSPNSGRLMADGRLGHRETFLEREWHLVRVFLSCSLASTVTMANAEEDIHFRAGWSG